MNPYLPNVPNTQSMYNDMGKACAGKLKCNTCGKTKECSAKDAAAYLRFGWPRCCGYTMELTK